MRKKKFIQDVAILQFASFFSTGIAIMGSVIYARVLGIEGYASYILIFTFVSFFGIFINLGTSYAALTILSEAYSKQEKGKVLDVLTYYLKVTLAVTIIVSLIIIIFAPYITGRLYSNSEIGSLARLIFFAGLLGIVFDLYTIVLQVIRKIRILAIIETIQKISLVLAPATLVLLGFGLKGLIFGYLSVTAIFFIFSIFAYSNLSKAHDILPSWLEIFGNFWKVNINYYFKFGFLVAIDKNLGSLYSILPIFILGIFSLHQVAYFKIAVAYAGLPSLFTSSVSRLLTVQLPKSKSYSLEILKRDFIRSSIGNLSVTFLIAILFIFLAPVLIPLIYGQEYSSAVWLSWPLLIGTIILNLGVGHGPLFRTLHLMKKSIIFNSFSIPVGGLIIYWFIKNMPIQIFIFPIAFWLPLQTIIFFIYLIIQLNKKIKYQKEIINKL